MEKEYKSAFTGDIGFRFQEELLLYSSLTLRNKLKCDEFSVGYEVTDFPKFDDVVCDFRSDGKRYLMLNQAKFMLKERKLGRERLISGGKNFNLKEYLPKMMEISEKTPENCELFFIITTTASMDMKDLPMDPATNNVIQKFFCELTESGAKVLQINAKFRGEIEKILQQIDGYESSDKDSFADYILQRLIFVTKCPNVDKMKAINNILLIEDYSVSNIKSFYEAIRNKIEEFLKFNQLTRIRKAILKADFDVILQNAALDVDLPGISKSFLKKFPQFVEFQERTLRKLNEDLQNGSNLIKSNTNMRLDALRIYFALRTDDPSTLLVPMSKITKFQYEALKFYDKKIVILMDNEEQECDLYEKKHIFYVGKARSLTSVSYQDLTYEAQRKFSRSKIGIQDHLVSLYKLKNTDHYTSNYLNLLMDFFRALCKDGEIHLGRNLPDNKIPNPYILREYVKRGNECISENDLFQTYRRCIIKGDPGLGKTSSLQNMAMSFKAAHPEFWVEFFQLRLISDKFFDFQAQNRSFTKEGAKEFLLSVLISYGASKELDRKLLEYYFTQDSPPIFLIFDGFDEIMPIYEEIIVNFIEKLTFFNFSIYISGRSHVDSVLRQLKDFEEVKITHYSTDMRQIFIEEYYKVKTNSTKVFKRDQSYLNGFFKDLDEVGDAVSLKPLYVKMMIDIVYHEQQERSKAKSSVRANLLNNFPGKINTIWLYTKIFELSFEDYYEKAGIPSKSNMALMRKEAKMHNIKVFHAFIAAKELGIEWPFAEPKKLENNTEILTYGFLNLTADEDFSFVHITFADYFLASIFIGYFDLKGVRLSIFKRIKSNIENNLVQKDNFIETFLCMLMEKICFDKDYFAFLNTFSLTEKREIMIIFNALPKFSWKNSIIEFKAILQFIWKYFKEDYEFYISSIDFGSMIDSPINEDLRIFDKIQCAFSLFNRELFTNKLCSYFGNKFETELIYKLAKMKDLQNFTEIYEIIEKNSQSPIIFLHKLCLEVRFKEGQLKDIDLLEWCIWKIFCISKNAERDCRKMIGSSRFFAELIKNISSRAISVGTTFEEFIGNSCLFYINVGKLSVYEVLTEIFVPNPKRETPTTCIGLMYKFFGRDTSNFILSDNNSILYKMWRDEKKKDILCLFKVLPKEIIEKLTISPHFGGQSLKKCLKSDQRNDLLEIIYYCYLYRVSDQDKMIQYFGSSQTTIPNADLAEIIVKSVKIAEIFVIFGFNFNEMIKCLLDEVYRNVLNLNSTAAINVFYEITKLHYIDILKKTNNSKITEETFKKLIRQMFDYFLKNKSENYVIEKNCQKDEDGNVPLQNSILYYNIPFIWEFLRFAKTNQRAAIRILSCTNNNGQNTLHSHGTFKWNEVWIHFKSLLDVIRSDERAQRELFLKKDIEGRTPLHSTYADNQGYFIEFLSSQIIIDLLKLVDKEGNNILHYLAIHTDSVENELKTFSLLIKKMQNSIEDLKDALNLRNIYKLTPLDVCKNQCKCSFPVFGYQYRIGQCELRKKFKNILY